MPKYREIRARIHGIENTAKITQAMKMVAAAKLRRAQDAIIASRPYTAKLREMIASLATNMEAAVSPLLEEREVNRRMIIVVSADRGLCGAFNSNLLKVATNYVNSNCAPLVATHDLDIVTVGKRATDFFSKRKFDVTASYPGIFQHLEYATASRIMNMVSDRFLRGEVDRVDIIHNEFKSAVKQTIATTQLLPIPKLAATAKANPIDYIFEPSRDILLSSLLPKSLSQQIWSALLESNAAEQGARMSAMENATKNAKDLTRSLKLIYNKARQAAITTEIIEIVSGAQALEG